MSPPATMGSSGCWIPSEAGDGRAGTLEAAVIDVGAGISVGIGVLRPTEDAL